MSEPQEATPILGRPPKYYPERCYELLSLMQKGYSNLRVCASWGISTTTFYQWRKDYPDFDNAYQIGNTAGEAEWEDIIKNLALGKLKGNVTAALAYCNRKYHWAKDESNKTVNIGSINVQNNYASMDVQTLQEDILKKLQRNSLVIDAEPTE